MRNFHTVIGLLCFLAVEIVYSEKNVPVTLEWSSKTKIIGTEEKTSNDRTFYAFRGIPYAEVERWTESKVLELTKPEYDATKYGDFCVQWWGGTFGSEDCLNINIFTPKLPEKGKKSPLLPVMFYIHGGGYILGTSNGIGPKILMKHDVVLVTINYRLGVFGYLSTGDKNLPGNYGALDQVTALDWVQKNIAKFGGDPKSVTIFGHSAGAGAPHLLALSPRAKGKFHKVILQSGTAINSWVTDKHPSYYASDYAKRAGCPQKVSSTELVDCLKGKTTQELIDVQKDTIDYFLLPMWIQNVVDGHSRPSGQSFLPDHPEKLIENKKYDESIPLMTGVTSAEGIMGYTFIHLAEGDKFLDADHFTTKIVPRMVSSLLPYGYEDEVERISEAVLKQYFPGGKDKLTEDDIVKGTIELQGDSLFNWGNRAILQKYAKLGHKKLYSYVISHKAKKSPSTVWAQLKEMKDKGFSINHPLIQTGVGHVDDMYFLFDPSEIFPSDPTYKWTPEDVKFADFMSSVWVAFAKTGSPAEGISKMNGYPEWKTVESGSVNYYNLTSVSTPMGRDFREKGSEFWNRVYKSLEGKIKENRKIDEL